MTDSQYEYMKLIEDENFRLKKQLKKKTNEWKHERHLNRVLLRKNKELEERTKRGKKHGK